MNKEGASRRANHGQLPPWPRTGTGHGHKGGLEVYLWDGILLTREGGKERVLKLESFRFESLPFPAM